MQNDVRLKIMANDNDFEYDGYIEDEDALFLVSPIPPSVNHYLSYRTIMKAGKSVSISYKTKEAKAYQTDFCNYVAMEATNQNWRYLPNDKRHIYVDAIFYFPRTDQDCNNYWKVLLDAITDSGVVWLDDNIVCERVQHIFYDAKNPRIELKIHRVNYIGIFDDYTALSRFQSKCKTCSRYSRNCSVLKRAIGGFVQDEIRNDVCIKYKLNKKGVTG